MKNKTKIGFISLGCPKNQIDTEVMLHEVVSAGYEITPEEIEADIIIVNTCAFIESAKQESIDNIIDIAWLKKNSNLKGIIVTGCLAQRYRDDIFNEMPEVDAILGVGSIHDIVEAIESVENKQKYTSYKDTSTLILGGDRVITTPEYMAYLKVAEGCDNHCTYCAIPLIRGGFRSRTIEDIVLEAKTLDDFGIKELIVIAQDTTRYGKDLYGDYKLAELLRKITEETNIPWIRILYCYPDKITDELICEIRDNPRILKYIDMPIQHISDDILKKMNRCGDSKLIKSVIQKLRAEIPEIIIRTTAIVGFPTETEDDFRELCEFVHDTKFERLGVFTYSREEDTPAYYFDCQVDEQTKQDRYDILMKEQLIVSDIYNQKMLGETISVLCEGYDKVAESYFGRSYADAAEIDGKIYFSSTNHVDEGEFVDVKITEILDYDLIGEKI